MSRLAVGVLLLLALSSAWASRLPRPGLSAVPAPSRPSRHVVSVTLATDEILLALLPAERIAALTRFADDPRASFVLEEAKAVPGRVDLDAERIAALRPDLVLVASYLSQDPVRLLESIGIRVERMPSCFRLDGIRAGVRAAGRAVGEETGAEALVRSMDARLKEVSRRTAGLPRPRVFYYTPSGYTAGRGTLFDELLEAAGARNAAAEAGVEGEGSLPLERVLQADPDVILVSTYQGDSKARTVSPERSLLEDPVWQCSTAVRTGRVLTVSERDLTCVSHHVADAAEHLARLLHPEAFR